MMLTVTRSTTSRAVESLKKFRLAIIGNRKYTHYMANWTRQILINVITNRAQHLTEADESLEENPEFLQAVARHILALCKHGNWVPDIDGWDPGFDEWAVTDIENTEDFDNFLYEIYNEADAERIWCGLGHEELPTVHSNIEGVGWIGDFSKFATVPHGS